MDKIVGGTQIIFISFLQIILFIISLYFFFMSRRGKDQKMSSLPKILLVLLLLVSSLGFYFYIIEFNTKLKRLIARSGEIVPSIELISGLEQREFFPIFEIIITILIFLTLVYIIIDERKLAMKK